MREGSSVVAQGLQKKVLLAEGPGDVEVLRHLIRRHKITIDIEIEHAQGKQSLLQTLPGRLIGSELGTLGIVLDADASVINTWRSLRNRLQHHGYQSIPAHPAQAGTIIKEIDKPLLGIWVMPDNHLPGVLEDFIRYLIPSHDCLWPLVEQTVQQVIAVEQRFSSQHVTKAKIHSWLAWQKEPGVPMGQAITKRFFDSNCQEATLFLDWIRRLFV